MNEDISFIFDKFIEEFKDLYKLFDTFNLYNKDNSKPIPLMYKKAILLSTYVTICKLLEEDKTLPIETLRKELSYLKDSSGKELFPLNKITTSSQTVFSRTIRKIKQTKGRRNTYYVSTTPEKYYLYYKILLKSEQRPHSKRKRKLISRYCSITRMFLLINFKRVSPETLYQKIYYSKNIDEFYDEIIKYSNTYDSLMNILFNEYNKNISIINEFISLESLIPLNLLYHIFFMLYKIKNLDDLNYSIEQALLALTNLPKTFLLTKHGVKSYYTCVNLNELNNSGSKNSADNLTWSENFINSIKKFSEILFPLISKSFFTFIFYKYKKDEDESIYIVLERIKTIIETYFIKNKNLLDIPKKVSNKFEMLKNSNNHSDNTFDILKKFILKFILNFIYFSLDNYKKIDYYTFSLNKSLKKPVVKPYLLDMNIVLLTENIRFFLNNITIEDINNNKNNEFAEVIEDLYKQYHSIEDNYDKNSSENLIKMIQGLIDKYSIFRVQIYFVKINNNLDDLDNLGNLGNLIKNLISISREIANSNARVFNHNDKLSPLSDKARNEIAKQFFDYYIYNTTDITNEDSLPDEAKSKITKQFFDCYIYNITDINQENVNYLSNNLKEERKKNKL